MKTILLGLDAFDPTLFENLHERGRLPNLSKYVEAGRYSPFEVSNPPQSEVSWTSIATGLNPGTHGLFDFVHRDAATYQLIVSLLPTKQGLGGIQFVRPYSARTIFDQAVSQGYLATALWWPATFPARPESPVRTLPGLGTPDLMGRLGVGSLFSSDREIPDIVGKTPVSILEPKGNHGFALELIGPTQKTRRGPQETRLDLDLKISDEKTALLQIDNKSIELTEGVWSQMLELQFRVGRFFSVRGITRAILTQIQPETRLYFLPIQIHPLHAPWRYGTPQGFVKNTWKSCGPFLTLGWPQDTTGLEDQCIDDEQFLALCDSIFSARVCAFKEQIFGFREGVLASVFDSLDRIQHMFLRDRPDIIEQWYLKLDHLVGDVESWIEQSNNQDARLVIVSDHGFTRFDYKVHLNQWLLQQGFLATKEDNASRAYKNIDWKKTKAYAIGLNSLYLNLKGREGQGQVSEGEREALLQTLVERLGDWKGADGNKVVQSVLRNQQAFDGQMAAYGPDLLIGYAPGYRASQQTGLGDWEAESLEPNRDHWGADHCIAAQAVPGAIFSNQDFSNFSHPSYRDIPAITIDTEPDATGAGMPPPTSQGDDDAVEERLKSLGYL
jgi:predicted AlkP superfamily phosphohydrolase/phosphomutase